MADWQPLAEMRLLGALSASWSNLVRLNEVVQPLLGSVGAAGSGVRDLSNLGSNTNISSLSLSACSIETLSGLDQAPRLDDLTLREVYCNDFSGLIQAPNLRKLELAGSNFQDISLLARCPALKQVSVRGCTVFGWEELLDAPPRSIDKKMIKALEAAGHVVRERLYPNRTDPPRTNPGW